MSRGLHLPPLVILSLVLFGAASALGLLAHFAETAHASKTVVSSSTLRKPPERVTAVSPTATISQQPLLQAHATLPLTSPASWQRPSLAAGNVMIVKPGEKVVCDDKEQIITAVRFD